MTDELCLDRVVQAVRNFNFVQEIFIIGKAEGYVAINDLLLKGKTGSKIFNIPEIKISFIL